MSLHISLENGHKALHESGSSPAFTFALTCNCGWRAQESRAYVEDRIRRHYRWPDAEEWEVVTVTPIEAKYEEQPR